MGRGHWQHRARRKRSSRSRTVGRGGVAQRAESAGRQLSRQHRRESIVRRLRRLREKTDLGVDAESLEVRETRDHMRALQDE